MICHWMTGRYLLNDFINTNPLHFPCRQSYRWVTDPNFTITLDEAEVITGISVYVWNFIKSKPRPSTTIQDGGSHISDRKPEIKTTFDGVYRYSESSPEGQRYEIMSIRFAGFKLSFRINQSSPPLSSRPNWIVVEL